MGNSYVKPIYNTGAKQLYRNMHTRCPYCSATGAKYLYKNIYARCPHCYGAGDLILTNKFQQNVPKKNYAWKKLKLVKSIIQ